MRKRANILLFLLPVTVSIGVGGMHLLSQSFLIYLKYQAMVDSYYYNVVMKQQISVADAPTQVIAISEDENQNSTDESRSSDISENTKTTNQ